MQLYKEVYSLARPTACTARTPFLNVATGENKKRELR